MLLFKATSRKKILKSILGIGTAAGCYVWYHLDEAPITKRKRFISISGHRESLIGENTLQQLVSVYHDRIIPKWDPIYRTVDEVTRRLLSSLPELGVKSPKAWSVTIVDSDEPNALVLPSGEIFVFTGIIPIAKNVDGLAAVLGHEIGHWIARHSAENISISLLTQRLTWIFRAFVLDWSFPFPGVFSDIFISLPFSRKCEREADYIGLLLMSKAGFDPRESILFWKRMQRIQKQRATAVPTFLSTHPATDERIRNIEGWLPDAVRLAGNS